MVLSRRPPPKRATLASDRLNRPTVLTLRRERVTLINTTDLSTALRSRMAKQVYSLADCKQHVSDKDCWLVVHGECEGSALCFRGWG